MSRERGLAEWLRRYLSLSYDTGFNPLFTLSNDRCRCYNVLNAQPVRDTSTTTYYEQGCMQACMLACTFRHFAHWETDKWRQNKVGLYMILYNNMYVYAICHLLVCLCDINVQMCNPTTPNLHPALITSGYEAHLHFTICTGAQKWLIVLFVVWPNQRLTMGVSFIRIQYDIFIYNQYE